MIEDTDISTMTPRGKRAIEIGHIYFAVAAHKIFTGEEITEFAHLKNYEFNWEDTLFVLVDDKGRNSNVTDQSMVRDGIVNYLWARFNLPDVSVIFESSFLAAQDVVAKLTPKAGSKDWLNWRFLIQQYKKTRVPTCFLLSLAWAMYRAEAYSEVVTIIDKKYQSLERQVREFLPDKYRKNYKLIWI